MQKLGIGLIILSYAKWLVIPFVHTFPISTGWKTTIYVGLVVICEIFFWSGLGIIGVETYRRLKAKFNFFKRPAKAHAKRKDHGDTKDNNKRS